MNAQSDPIYFNPDGCLTYEGLKALHSGLVADEVQHQLIAHVSSCPLCSSAAEGFSKADNLTFDENYQKIHNQLLKTTIEKRSRPKNNAAIFRRFSISISPAMIKFAAAILLLLSTGTVWLLSTMQITRFNRPHVASNTLVIDPLSFPKDSETVLAPGKLLMEDIIMLPPLPPQVISNSEMLNSPFDETFVSDDKLKVVAYIMPEFTVADAELQNSVEFRIDYPLLLLANLNGRVSLSFIVETDGSLSQVRVLRGLSPVHDQAASAWIMKAGIWQPGIHHNGPCRVLTSLIVNFNQGVIQIKKC